MNENIFSDMERDVIGEVMNISLGSSATSLSTLLGKRVEITVPKVNVINAVDFNYENLEPAIGVEINYIEGLKGVNLMIWKRLDAKAIIEILMGQTISIDEFEMDEINTSAICEVMNQMMGSSATALSDFLGKTINISTPLAYEINDEIEFRNKYFIDEDVIVAVSFELFIEGTVQSQFINVMPILLAREIVSNFLKGSENPDNKSIVEKNNKEESPESIVEIVKSNKDIHEDFEDEIDELYEKKATTKNNRVGTSINQKKKEQTPVNVRKMEYEKFDDDVFTEEQLSNLDLIMTVPLEISVEIGKSRRRIKDILEFSKGTIVELDKQAGALVDVIVNGQLVAKGEVVVVNDNFGVRIVEIIKKDELIKITL
ncbi:MAG: flagellar motor switch phosphatase FliY [Sedimentibacter sp.]